MQEAAEIRAAADRGHSNSMIDPDSPYFDDDRLSVDSLLADDEDNGFCEQLPSYGPEYYSPEAVKAMEGVQYIANHLKRETEAVNVSLIYSVKKL